PLSWGHYYMAQAPAVLLVPIWLLQRGKLTQAKVVAVIPPVLSWSHYLAMPRVGGLGLLGLGTTAWFLGVCGLIVGGDVIVALKSLILAKRYRERLSLDGANRCAVSIGQNYNAGLAGGQQHHRRQETVVLATVHDDLLALVASQKPTDA